MLEGLATRLHYERTAYETPRFLTQNPAGVSSRQWCYKRNRANVAPIGIRSNHSFDETGCLTLSQGWCSHNRQSRCDLRAHESPTYATA